jgi:hypothetical protein
MKTSHPLHKAPRPKETRALSSEAAETLALQALGFLLQDEERIDLFLRLTGTDPTDLRALATSRQFLLAVLDHLATGEQLLLEFARALEIAPERIGAARMALGGGETG